MAASLKTLTVKDAAVELGVSMSTIYRMLKRGELTGWKIGSDWRFNIEDFEQWRRQHPIGQVDTAKHNPHKRKSE